MAAFFVTDMEGVGGERVGGLLEGADARIYSPVSHLVSHLVSQPGPVCARLVATERKLYRGSSNAYTSVSVSCVPRVRGMSGTVYEQPSVTPDMIKDTDFVNRG